MPGLIERLLGGRGEPDGSAALLESYASETRMPTDPPGVTESDDPARGRRERPMDADEVIHLALAQKTLHGWLQNRHQTLFPLTVNLRSMPGEQIAVLAGVAAIAAHACGAPGAERTGTVRTWFTQVGASAAVIDALKNALGTPPAMDPTLGAVLAQNLAAYAYVVALIAIDGRDPASGPFLAYLAARLALPATVVRSATRRYRR